MEFTTDEAVAPAAVPPWSPDVMPDVDDLADEQPEPESRMTPDVPSEP